MRNESLRVTVVATIILALVLVAVAAAADPGDKIVTVTAGKDGDDLTIAVSRALAMEVLAGAIGSTLSCDGAVDSEFGSMLRTLDRGGRGARATLRDDDSVIEARRRANSLRLDIRDLEGAGRIEVVMPWAVAECLLGRDVTLDESARKVKVKIVGAGGGTFEFKID